MNFVKDGIQEMLIQRPDDKKNLIVYKHPENTIPTGAQLTVDADEAAVFFRDGGLVGACAPPVWASATPSRRRTSPSSAGSWTASRVATSS
ncbi:MAG: hypothetical protein IPG81_20755 [Sandaracinaceae bacterium]|nr:hypothetical protein [Sandaracinaceae bacterium]